MIEDPVKAASVNLPARDCPTIWGDARKANAENDLRHTCFGPSQARISTPDALRVIRVNRGRP